jgi:hypothetical protein
MVPFKVEETVHYYPAMNKKTLWSWWHGLQAKKLLIMSVEITTESQKLRLFYQ